MTIFKIGDVVKMRPFNERYRDPQPGAYPEVFASRVGKEFKITRIAYGKWASDGRWNFDDSWIELAKISYKTLYNRAKEYKIVGRSKMNKEQLKEAVNKVEEENRAVANKQKEEELAKQREIAAKKVEEARKKEEEFNKLPLGEALVLKSKGKGGICQFAIESATHQKKFYVGQMCHAALDYNGVVGDKITFVMDISVHYASSMYKDLYKHYVEWMLNRSPWAVCFITKDVDEALKGGVYCDVDKPFDHIACSAVALRQGSEFPNKLRTWGEFLDRGYSENVSFVMANIMNGRTRIGIGSGHDIFVSLMNMGGLCKFFNTGFHRRLTYVSFKKQSHERYAIWGSIADQDEPSLAMWIVNQLPPKNWDDAGGYKEEDVVKCADALKLLITT